jgi:hypothetical protein
VIAEKLSHAYWLTSQALGFAGASWLPTILLVMLCLITGIHLMRERGAPVIKGKDAVNLLIPSSLTVALLLWGTLFSWPESAVTTAPMWRSAGVLCLLALHLAACVFIWTRAVGYRAFAFAVLSLQFWVALNFARVAAMSVTSNWV